MAAINERLSIVTLTSELAGANKARWELARILLGDHISGDIEALHHECIKEAKRLTHGRDRQPEADSEAR